MTAPFIFISSKNLHWFGWESKKDMNVSGDIIMKDQQTNIKFISNNAACDREEYCSLKKEMQRGIPSHMSLNRHLAKS